MGYLDEMQLKYFRYEIKVFKNIITKQIRKTGDRYMKKNILIKER